MEFLKNFLKSLLDLKFENYITLKILGILLILAYILDTIFVLSLCSTIENFLEALILFIIFYPISLVIVRINFEAFSALIKIAENTSKINAKLEILCKDIKKLEDEKCLNTK